MKEEYRILKELLEKAYGERLQGALIFGSEAQGRATPASDLDLLIVLSSKITPEDYRRFFDGVEKPFQRRYGLRRLSPVLLEKRWLSPRLPLLWEDIILLHDPERSLRDCLEEVEEKKKKGLLVRHENPLPHYEVRF